MNYIHNCTYIHIHSRKSICTLYNVHVYMYSLHARIIDKHAGDAHTNCPPTLMHAHII